MADKILNQAAINAANEYNRELARQQIAAGVTKARLEPNITSATGYVSTADKYKSVFEKLSKKAPDVVSSYGEAIPGIQQKATEFTTGIIQPYQEAVGILGRAPMAVPKPVYQTDTTEEDKKRQGQSAYNILFEQFSQYGLGALVEPLKKFIVDGLSPEEFTIRLRDTDAYKERFAANAKRIANGLRALSEAEYIRTEDAYQDVMRRYGMPESYYSRGNMGRQEGFEKFIAGDVSVTELEDRIATAQNRVINAAPEISATLRTYYPDITNGDILAYVLDPSKAIENIKRKVTAAEIGGAATMAGLNRITPDMTPEQIAALRGRAEELARYGVTGEAARQGFQTVAEVAPRGGQLAEIYKQTPYTQATAETEVFGLGGATEAARQRKKLSQLEQATFSGQSGITSGALARDRAGTF